MRETLWRILSKSEKPDFSFIKTTLYFKKRWFGAKNFSRRPEKTGLKAV